MEVREKIHISANLEINYFVQKKIDEYFMHIYYDFTWKAWAGVFVLFISEWKEWKNNTKWDVIMRKFHIEINFLK